MNASGDSISTWDFWRSAAHVPLDTPVWIVSIIALIFTYVVVILPSGAVMSYFERKLSADLQARVGPNRAGPAGILQPISDFLKLLQKQSREHWSWREAVWLGVHTMALYSTVAVLPLGSHGLLIDTDMSAFLPFWATLVFALGTMLVGLSQKTVPGWFGGLRVASQAMAAAFPAAIAILCAGVHAGSLKWSGLAAGQGAYPYQWAMVSDPFQVIAFLVFVISGLVLMGIPPLDGGMSIPDIHGGVASQVHGRRMMLFRLSRFYGFFLWSVIAVTLFLGAWQLPEALVSGMERSQAWGWLHFLEVSTLLVKTFLVMIGVILVATVTPRLRSDQVTDLAWKVLSPFGLMALAGTALVTGWRLWT